MMEILQIHEFAKWLKRLKDAAGRAHILMRIQRLSLTNNFGDVKSVSDGVFKMRIDFAPGPARICRRAPSHRTA